MQCNARSYKLNQLNVLKIVKEISITMTTDDYARKIHGVQIFYHDSLNFRVILHIYFRYRRF